jgi:DNA-binding beta-propeller fold protein YncE
MHNGLVPPALLLALLAATPPAAADTPFATFERASEAVLADPHDLAIGPDGRLYVADKFASRIAILDADTLELVGSFGDGLLPGVHDISFGPDGRAYLAVTGASAVAVYDLASGTAEQVAVYGPFARTEGALAHSNGQLYVTVGGTGEVVAVRDGTLVASVQGGHYGAHDIAEAPDGSVWVADNFNRRLVRYSADLDHMQTLEGAPFGFVGPRYLDVDDFGRLVVADQDAHRILLIDPATGTLEGVLGDGTPGMGPGKFDDPEGVAIHGNAYYVADSDNNRVVKYVVVLN